MPALTNSIGDFEFLEMEGSVFLRQEELELIERAGVDGTGVRKLGQRSKPFQLVTTNYVASYSEARSALIAYTNLVGDDPVDLVRCNVNFGTFLVLSVVENFSRAIFNSLGGFSGGEECCQEVTWTLLG